MNTRVVGSKTMVMIVTPLSGWKEVTCLLPTNQYSNEVANLGMTHVLLVSALRFSRGVQCWCWVITSHNEINCLFKFMLTISNLPTSKVADGMVTSQLKFTPLHNLHTSLKKMFHQQNDDVYTMLMCNEQYPCVGPIELLYTINRTPDGILNLLQSTITPTHDAILYYNRKWNIPCQGGFLGYSFTRTNPIRFDIPSRCSIEKLKDVIKQVAPLGVPPYGIHESQVVRWLFFWQLGHAKYSEKLIEYEITIEKWWRCVKGVSRIQLLKMTLPNRNFSYF